MRAEALLQIHEKKKKKKAHLLNTKRMKIAERYRFDWSAVTSNLLGIKLLKD